MIERGFSLAGLLPLYRIERGPINIKPPFSEKLTEKGGFAVMLNIQKCAIIGTGFVGATTAFALLRSGLFSEMVLIDQNREKAEGEAMDLSHCDPFVRPVNVWAGDYCDLVDCALVIITAGANQGPNETRLDLVQKNTRIFGSIIPQIVRYNRECILLVVANPVDVLTYVALKLSGFPPERVIGSGTVLDTARLKYLLSEHLEVDSRNVHAFIIGEHGDTELPVWSSANVSGVDIADFCRSCQKCGDMACMKEIYDEVKNSAYEVIQKKGATYYAIALAVLRIAEAILRDEHSVLTVSGLVSGHYGLDGLCLGLPSIVGRRGIEQTLDVPLDEGEQQALEKSARALKEVIDQLEL